jgi:hypothetical protein
MVKTLFRHRCTRGLTALFMLSFMCCVNFNHGTGSSSGNPGMTGKVVAPDGAPATQTVVQCVPEGFDPLAGQPLSDNLCDTTDDTGAYDIRNLPSGVYALQAVNIHNRQRFLKTGIVVDTQLLQLISDTLRLSGTVRIELPKNVDATNGYLYIPGTLIGQSLAGRSDSLILDSVPAGVLPEIRYTARNTSVSRVIRYNIQVHAGTSVSVANPAWHYATYFSLNTTASGANVSGNVIGFPVLVRLNSSNFNFSHAKSGGEDIRFAKLNETSLPYEVERWDLSVQKAEVWVRVDTVLGNDTMQNIVMYSGNADSASQSSGAAVFDTSAGFQGVWHMNESGTVPIKDATQNRYDGTPSVPPPVGVPGLIGLSQKFNGVSNFIIMNGTANSRLNFPVNGYYTVSAWVNLDSILGLYKVFISKGYTQYTLQINGRKGFDFSEYHDNLGWQYSAVPASARVWKYVVGVREGTNQYLYIDGAVASSTIIVDSSTTQRFTGDDLSVGTASGGIRDFLNGSLDELSISSVSRGSDWIKLCYMNQRADDKLVWFH